MRRTCPCRANGFSLVEVLVALLLFSIAVGVLVESVSNALRGLEAVSVQSNETQDLRFAMRQVVQVKDRDELESGGELKTVTEKTVSWKAEVEETNIVDLFKVDVTLTHSDNKEFGLNAEEEGTQETVYLLRPDWSEEQDRNSLIEEKKDALENNRNTPSF